MARAETVRVRGLRELNRAFKVADKSLRKNWRREQRAIGEPVAAMAQTLAIARIPGLTKSVSWSQMRVGVTTRVVYVAPRSRRKTGSKRPNLAPLLMNRAMLPALKANEENTVRRVDNMLVRMSNDWENA